jgi:hypothetical protein
MKVVGFVFSEMSQTCLGEMEENTKTKQTQFVLGFMLAQDSLLGSQYVIPFHRNYKIAERVVVSIIVLDVPLGITACNPLLSRIKKKQKRNKRSLFWVSCLPRIPSWDHSM